MPGGNKAQGSCVSQGGALGDPASQSMSLGGGGLGIVPLGFQKYQEMLVRNQMSLN